MHRSRFEIIAAVLEFCRNVPKRQNWVLHGCNINPALFRPMVKKLVSEGLLVEVQLKRYRKLRKYRCGGYLTTDVGQEWLMKYHALIGMLNVAEIEIK